MKEQRRYRIIWLSIALVVFVVVSLGCGSTTPTSEPSISTATSQGTIDTQSTAETTAPESPTTASPAESYLGDVVQSDGIAFTALQVSDPAVPGSLYQPEEGQKLIAIEVVISNISADSASSNSLDFTLLDKDGYKYNSGLADIDNQLDTVDLRKGEQVQGWISFKIPENSSPALIGYSPSLFGDELKASLSLPPAGHTPASISLSINPPQSKLGDVVEQYGFSLIAKTIEDPTNAGMFYTEKDGYKPIAVEIELGNVSASDSLSVNTLYAYLVDTNGFVYSAELFGRDGDLGTADLAVGEKVKGWVTFVVPNNATPAYIKYQTDVISGNYLVAGLLD